MHTFLAHPNGRCTVRSIPNGDITFIRPWALWVQGRRGNAENTLRIEPEGEFLKCCLNGQFVNKGQPPAPIPSAFVIG